MHRLFKYILFSSTLLSVGAFAQEFLNRDSLWKELRMSEADTNKVLLYIQLGQQYENNNPDSALVLYEEALQLSRELNYTMGVIKYYTNATYVYNVLGRYDTALVLNLQSVEIARAFGNQERLAACLANVGSSYLNLRNYETSIDYILQALRVYESLKMPVQLSSLTSNLCIVYRETSQLDKSLEYGLLGVAYARESKSDYLITVALNNLAVVYTELNKPDEAIVLLHESLRLSKVTENIWGQITANLNMVDARIKQSQFEELKPYLDEALHLSKSVDDQESIVIILKGYSIYYLYTGAVDQAEKYGLESLRLATENKYPLHMASVFDHLAKVALMDHDFKKSNRYSFLSDSTQSTIFNERIASNVQQLEARFKSDQQLAQIRQLEDQANWNRIFMVSLVAAFLAVITIVVLAYRTYSQRKKILDRDNLLQQSRIKQLEKEKQLLASEAIIRGQEEERTRMAKDLHDGLGGMLSGVKFSLTNMKVNTILDADATLVFERALDMLDHSIQELRRVAHNMMPEVLINFGLSEAVRGYCESIQQTKMLAIEFNSIGMTERLSREVEIHSFRIIQELLNNILRHANAKQVVVQLSKHDHQFIITVEDDGKGFDVANIRDKNSAGLANIRNRLNLLKGTMEIDSALDKGTSIEINIALS